MDPWTYECWHVLGRACVLEVFYFGGVILGGADERGEIYGCLDVVDLPAVLLGLLQNLSRLIAATTAQLGLSNNTF